MNMEQLDVLFREEALEREHAAIDKCGHRPGRFQVMAKDGALKAAIKLIKDKKPSEGLTRLFLCSKTKYKDAYKLSIEQIFVDFSEKYGDDFPDIFNEEVVEAAKRKLLK